MKLIYRLIQKEWRSFFSSTMGWLIVGTYLVVSGLMLWVIDSPFNVFKFGFGHLQPYFELTPWLLVVLIPAIAMRSIAQERQQGTIDLLRCTPISDWQLVLGKYLSIVLLILAALLPSLIYILTIYQTSTVPDYVDTGSMMSGYIGLVFLTMTFSALGLFASSTTNKPIVAFILGVAICSFCYQGLSILGLGDFQFNHALDILNKGVIPCSAIAYFLLASALFTSLTLMRIQQFKVMRLSLKPMLMTASIYLILIYLSTLAGGRLDLTDDHRYTLNEASVRVIESVDQVAVIDVFLESDNFPREFQRLRDETIALLEEITAINDLISFQLIDPLEDPQASAQNIEALTQRGMSPMQMELQENGQLKRQLIFPWALASLNNETVKIKLMANDLNKDQTALASESIAQLEWAIVDGLHKLTAEKTKKIAVLKGNGQLPDLKLADALSGLKYYYNLAPFTLDSVATNPQETLKAIKNYDLVISADPRERFSEEEKFTLDQYLMSGGNMLWMIDNSDISIESLLNDQGEATAMYDDYNLTDFFFSYGIRLNPQLLVDQNSAPLTLALGEGSETEFQTFPWPFRPLASNSNNLITARLAEVRFDFANPIELLNNGVKKTILLETSSRSAALGLPRVIDLDMISQLDSIPNKENKYVLGVLLEGTISSAFKLRLAPFDLTNRKEQSDSSKMIVFSDGQLIANDVSRNGPMELGYDQWTGQRFGNKELFLNAVSYLLNDFELIPLKQKTVELAFLDPQKILEHKKQWQSINIGIPVVILLALAYMNRVRRERKYGQTVDKFVSKNNQ